MTHSHTDSELFCVKGKFNSEGIEELLQAVRTKAFWHQGDTPGSVGGV